MAPTKIVAMFAGGVTRLMTPGQIKRHLTESFRESSDEDFGFTKVLVENRKKDKKAGGVTTHVKLVENFDQTYICGYVYAESLGDGTDWLDVFIKDRDEEPHALGDAVGCPHWHDLVWLPSVHGGWTDPRGFDCAHPGDVTSLDLDDRRRDLNRRTFKMPCWVKEQLDDFVEKLPSSLTLEWVQDLMPRSLPSYSLRPRSHEV